MQAKFLIPLFLAASFFFVGLLTLSNYGMNWDAPIRMVRGQAYLHLFLTGEKTYGDPERISPVLHRPGEYAASFNFLDTPVGGIDKPVKLTDRPLPRLEFEKVQQKIGESRSFYQHEAWNGEAAISIYDEPGHLPLADILSALTNKLFYQTFGLFGDIESTQLFYVFICAIGVFLVSLFAYQITNSFFAALIAGLSLALFPFFITEAHINMKDPLQATFLTGTIWSFWHWLKSGKLWWFGIFGVFVAFALGVKWNIVFLPFILLPWQFLIRHTEEFKRWFRLRRLMMLGILGGLAIFLFLVAIWPYAWADPIGKMIGVTKYYAEVGLESGSNEHGKSLPFFGFNVYPLILLILQTPEIIVILGFLGVMGVIRGIGGQLKVGYLVLFWFLVPIIRQIMPNMRFYMGLHQIMEVLPALAILCGIGSRVLLDGRGKTVTRVIQTVIMISFAILLLRIIQLHPNENTYFNLLAGGLKGAYQKNFVEWSLTYGNIYKQAAIWLNENAEDNANLALVDGSMYALSPLWLRSDISISPYHFSGFEKKGEYIISLLNPENPPVFAYRYPIRFLKPVFSIVVDGVPLITIYKNDFASIKNDFETENIYKNPSVKVIESETGNFLEIDLGKEVKVTKLILDDVLPQCRLSNNKRFIDSFVDFVPNSDLDLGTKDVLDPYSLLERRNLEGSRVEFLFAAEQARLIRIFPQNPFSCFFKGRIESVSYLKD